MTTTSSCAAPSTGTSASRTAALLPFLTGDRLHAMKHFLLAIVFLFQLAAWAQPDAALLAELRRGGYVLYIRHTSTDFGQNDAKMTGYEDCANQRNLTDKGRQEARAVGEHIKRLKIPVGRVLASPPYLAEGEIAVVRSQGDSAFAVVGRIRLQDWELLQ